MKKLLILGSDLGTIDIARQARKMGIYVITTDLMKNSPTKMVSDEAWNISTNDIDILEEKCREKGVDGVLYGVSEFNLACARKLCKRMGFPMLCKNDSAWEVARYKDIFKSICIQIGVPVPENYYLSNEPSIDELTKIKFPVVVKPVDMSANRGMSYCYGFQELAEAYHRAIELSPSKRAICERKLNGPEWVANYVLANGKARLLYFGKEYHPHDAPANTYSVIVTSAAHLKHYNEEVNEKVKLFFEKAKYTDGIGWVELMLDDDGHFYLIEPAYRFSSEAIYAMYERVSGFNAVKWVIETAIGKEHSEEELPADVNQAYKDCVASYHLFTTMDGEIERIEGIEELQTIPDIEVDIPKREGDAVKKNGIMGLVKVYGSNIEKLIYGLEKVNELLYVKNHAGENMYVRFYDYDQIREDYYLGLKQYSNSAD